MVIIGSLIIGIVVGIISMSLLSINRINEYEEKLNIEYNKVSQRDRLIEDMMGYKAISKAIENIVAKGMYTKESTVLTVDKIKEVLISSHTK